MIYLIIGGSCAGKSQFVKNSFLKGKQFREYKDLVALCETDSAYILGKYNLDVRQTGTDRISRKDIPLFFEQIKRLYGRGKDIVLEGDKIANHNLFQSIADAGMVTKLILIDVSFQVSKKRNEKLGYVGHDASLKRPITKAKNLYYDFCNVFQSEVYNSDLITDFDNFCMETEKPKGGESGLRSNFCVLILTHGRADRVYTYKTLKKEGYTGKIFFVVDNEDEQVGDYKQRFGEENVVVFDKAERAKKTDVADTVKDNRSVVFARNESFDIARKLGYRYFLELDDDYTDFQYRWASKDNNKLLIKSATNLDDLFEMMLQFLDESGALTVTFAQGGDMIGGVEAGNFKKGLLRKAMNTFFCDIEKPFQFLGRINEDVNTYCLLGSQGKLLFTYTKVMITQKQTQSNPGGWTEVYLERGTYVKSFYSVIFSPSCVRISEMGDKHMRVHHAVNWDKCVPQILNEKWKKVDEEVTD